jgi:ABC-2 type transport system permease protein
MSARLRIREQIWLIADLRWRVFRNSLRTLRGRLDVVSSALLWLMMGGLMLGGGAAIGIGAYIFVARHEAPRLVDLFWAVFLFWQFYPIFTGAGGVQFEFAHLLRFPLRYASFLTLSVAYGLFDPGAVVSLFWLVCLTVGAGLARPGLLAWAAAVSLIFAAMNLLLARAVSTWADRWLARRRTREILGLLFILVILTMQFALPMLARSKSGQRLAESWLAPFAGVAHALPPGVAAQAVSGGPAAQTSSALVGFFFVCLYALAFFWLLHLRLGAQYRGENLSEARAPAPSAAPARARGAAPTSVTWRLPWRSKPVAALFEREARYTLRNWPVMMQLLLPAFFVIVLSPGFKHGKFFAHHGQMIFPAAVAYAFFSETYWIFNSFGYDGAGIRFLLLAPVRFRQVMLGKNLLHATATFLNILLLWICVRLVFGPPELAVVALTLVASAYALLVNLAVGNVISIRFPNRLEFGVFRRGRGARGMSVALGLATQAVLMGSGALVFVIWSMLHRTGLALLIFLVLAAAASVGYVLTLREIDHLALSQKELLADELCRTTSAS